MIELKPKPITEIASRLRFLFCAILEAYASEDGRRVDYRSVHGSEEFARFDTSYCMILLTLLSSKFCLILFTYFVVNG